MAEHTPPSIDKVRNQAASIENHEPHTPEKLSTMGEKEYFKAAYPEGYGLEKKVNKVKIEASGANLNLFNHRKACFCTVIPEEVKRSGLSDNSKNVLLRFAHAAWEIRAEDGDAQGEQKYYFVLRDDVNVNGATESAPTT